MASKTPYLFEILDFSIKQYVTIDLFLFDVYVCNDKDALQKLSQQNRRTSLHNVIVDSRSVFST